MPIYEYQCYSCGHSLEAFQTISEAALSTCPHCQQASLQKLISATSFQLKGTGWYATDFKNKAAVSTSAEKTDAEKTDNKKPADTTTTTSTDGAAKAT